MTDVSRFWDSKQWAAPGLSLEQIQKWESDHGLQLPELLRNAYQEHDGGVVRGTTIRLCSLRFISVPDDDIWESMNEWEEEGFDDQSQVLIIGDDLHVGGNYLLNYNMCHDDEDPSIWNYFFDGCGASLLSRSASQYLQDAAEISEVAEASWQESENLPVVFDETIDESSWLPPGTVSRYRLTQGDVRLILFREGLDMNSGGKRLSRTELPLPLDPEQMHLKPRRPGGPWMLQLQPLDNEGIVSLESVQIAPEGWKNNQYRGVPIYEMIESNSPERLEALRTQLIGPDAAAAARREDQQMADLQRFSESSSENAHLAFMQMMHAMQQELPDLNPPGEVPELEGAASLIAQMQQQMVDELNRQIAGIEVPPEVQAVIASLKQKIQRPQP